MYFAHRHLIAKLTELVKNSTQSRTILLEGKRGSGKFSTAVKIAEYLIGNDFFVSPDIILYRNDDYALKTEYFIENFQARKEMGLFYFKILFLRMGTGLMLGEIKKNEINDSFSEFEQSLYSNNMEYFLKNKANIRFLKDISAKFNNKKNIPIDLIRQMIEFHSYSLSNKYKISIIGDFENATIEAQNAALKLLEEPTPNNYIFLTASSKNNILPTITSRALSFNVRLSSSDMEKIFGYYPGMLSLREVMENEMYGYHAVALAYVKEFFSIVALSVQKGNFMFEFVDKITNQESDKPLYYFMTLMKSVFEELLFARQELLRRKKTGIKYGFNEIVLKLARVVPSSEIKHWYSEINSIMVLLQNTKTRYNARNILTPLLIDISRWYQKNILKLKGP